MVDHGMAPIMPPRHRPLVRRQVIGLKSGPEWFQPIDWNRASQHKATIEEKARCVTGAYGFQGVVPESGIALSKRTNVGSCASVSVSTYWGAKLTEEGKTLGRASTTAMPGLRPGPKNQMDLQYGDDAYSLGLNVVIMCTSASETPCVHHGRKRNSCRVD